MSPRRPIGYSDDTPVRPSRPLGQQRGATTATVLDVVRELTADEKRRAGLFAASVAVRQDWSVGQLADVVAALGADDVSRTDKTQPVRLQNEDGAIWWQWGGVWQGVKQYRREHNRRDRQRARRDLLAGRDTTDEQPRHRAQWDLY